MECLSMQAPIRHAVARSTRTIDQNTADTAVCGPDGRSTSACDNPETGAKQMSGRTRKGKREISDSSHRARVHARPTLITERTFRAIGSRRSHNFPRRLVK
jgi:hypothetical protein